MYAALLLLVTIDSCDAARGQWSATRTAASKDRGLGEGASTKSDARWLLEAHGASDRGFVAARGGVRGAALLTDELREWLGVRATNDAAQRPLRRALLEGNSVRCLPIRRGEIQRGHSKRPLPKRPSFSCRCIWCLIL